jgi:streptomycin 6-kinase
MAGTNVNASPKASATGRVSTLIWRKVANMTLVNHVDGLDQRKMFSWTLASAAWRLRDASAESRAQGIALVTLRRSVREQARGRMPGLRPPGAWMRKELA